jgi:hypothetical protein
MLILAIALSAVAMFLALSRATYRLGFPLDDAWIHQTYARNLASLGQWAFVPGEPSAGSTSPLWTMSLAVGHLLRLDPVGWAHLLGTASLLFTAWLGARWARRRAADPGWLPVAVALTILVEWHLVWSAVSGMETLLLAAAAILALAMMEPEAWRPFRVGLVIGGAVWIRPDALVLLAAGAWRAWTESGSSVRTRAGHTARLLVGAAFALIPYLVFLRLTGDSWWPSTFYAKQAEYAILTQTPLLNRLWEVARAPLVGAGGLLLLAGLAEAAGVVRSRKWTKLAPLVWTASYLGAYALRLPVTYQHGRYQIPVVPVLIVLGWCGALDWLAPTGERWRWVVGRAWAGAVAVTLPAFLILGGRAYAQDVAIIESEMVDTAVWVSGQTPLEARVAAHDIGALGYFGGRDLLDLAGLTNPELIPILRDESALGRAMQANRVDYLVTFPDWYPALSACGEVVYASAGRFSPAAGGESMTVYRWRPDTFAARPACMLYSP